ncbi:4-hydroxythreonine-4-phosphate dehydrogenase [Desulfosalsimonas propionicica]|uniref:4-hydroxythreonine-4-phosphate dehydrogenase n=1 Tax=Desulfosalsimonas propionicica TaxID=332175 RepID=A0A7W0C9M6_9BACT|nr:4-hydroxythreonine-4-phosphate dehydrogenase PdxA [Desulfosalsimonas propionicica]MBA2881637.1 4-hydroxythreonine-4-phosphate dehydrogenase [Desulfosalsimonas propionicica]
MAGDQRPLIGITMGDPVGVGPEILCMALDYTEIYDFARPVVIGDPEIMHMAAGIARTGPKIRAVNDLQTAVYEPGIVNLISASRLCRDAHKWGHPSAETGRSMISYIEAGIDMAKSGQIDALVTCPINKAAMKLAGGIYPGHTEMLAQRTTTREYAMMMAGSRLRVVLATIHKALRDVSAALDENRIATVIRLTHQALKSRFGIARPRIAVCGLNPHAGEEEMFGHEEARLIRPAIAGAVSQGILATGPHPADTVFYYAVNGAYDAVVCMYHDQGLIPFKMVHFHDGVNTTLGLPIIRTSVDHGTAYDIAGKGIADPGSLMAAIEMAADHARRTKHPV